MERDCIFLAISKRKENEELYVRHLGFHRQDDPGDREVGDVGIRLSDGRANM